MGIFILLFCYQCLAHLGDAETQDIIFKILECIKVVKYAVKIMLECAS